MFKNIVSFIAGAAIGSGVTYYILKDKYVTQAQEDINAVKAEYKKREEQAKNDISHEEAKDEEPKAFHQNNIKPDIFSLNEKKKTDYRKFANKIQEEGYSESEVQEDPEDEDDISFRNVSPSEGPADKPFAISPEEFANTNPYFDKITLTYYDVDDVLCDEDDSIIDSPLHLVGAYFRTAFGEYEDDVAYVRNEKMGADYEILREHMSYKEVNG